MSNKFPGAAHATGPRFENCSPRESFKNAALVHTDGGAARISALLSIANDSDEAIGSGSHSEGCIRVLTRRKIE